MKLFFSILLILVFASCKKDTGEVVLPAISDYAPLVVGKFITYKIDSLVFINFNTTEAHRFYEVKYLVTDSLKDNLNRKAFKIVRFIRTGAPNPFVQDNAFMAINTGDTYEFVENYGRYLKLSQPIVDDFTWKGNRYLDAISSSTLNYLEDWDYTYDRVGMAPKSPLDTLGLGKNTITVNHINEEYELPVTPTTTYATKDFSKEVYAKGIGMVYRKFIHFVYQYNITTGIRGYSGEGITMQMINHN
jgi:hypothetical protein